MQKTSGHIFARVRLFTTEEGGRQMRTPSDKLHCIFCFLGEYFDCRLLFENTGPLFPGDSADVPILFLSPDLLFAKLHKGDKFQLREARIIGEGEVLSILPF